MYEIMINEDETITVDFWGPRLKASRQLRPDAWLEVMSQWRAEGGVLDFDPAVVQALFCDLRIDGRRAQRMLNAKGGVAAAPIDPAPEMAEEGEGQILVDELFNEEETFKALESRLGKQGVDFSIEEDMDIFLEMRETLRSEGVLRPGLRGI